MRGARGSARRLLPWLACAALLAGCRSVPHTVVSLPATSSLLAVDVLFPLPLSRDPSLVQAFFVKAPIGEGTDEPPDLIPSSFVKASRAYLLDPEPGSYCLVAVTAEYAPPWNLEPVAGVTDTVWSGVSSDAMIFPAELIHRTTTAVAPGEAAFMGALRVRRGDHINAHAVPRDALQRQIAERTRPGVTSESGLSGWLKRARVVDLEKTALRNDPADRRAFLEAALADLGDSPWAAVIARATASGEAPAARPGIPAPGLEHAAKREVEDDASGAAQDPAPIAMAAKPPAALPERAPLPPAPRPAPFPGIPPDSPLAKIERGMRHDEVHRILGDPDGRFDHVTAKAWIPFYDGPDANLRDWNYAGQGRVVFALYKGALTVIDVVYDPNQRK